MGGYDRTLTNFCGRLFQALFSAVSGLASRHLWIRETYQRITRPLRHGPRRILRGPAKGLLIDLHGSRPAYLLGLEENEVAGFIASNLGRGDVFYDLGANVGFFTLIAARLVGPEGHVYAFEPSPRTAGALHDNVELNQLENVTVVEAAVSERDGTMAFDEVGEVSPEARLIPRGEQGTIEVRIVAIDSFVGEGARQPKLVKIDVEGHENEVVHGMAGTLRSARPIVVCEIHQARHENEHEVERMLQELGYFCSWLEPGMHRQVTRWVPHIVGTPISGENQDKVRLAPTAKAGARLS
jgi:FkbM family methyltransferase